METNTSMTSQNDDNLWKMDSKMVADNKETANISPPGEKTLNDPNDPPPTDSTQNDAINIDGADYKFIPLQQSLSNMGPPLPGGRYEDLAASNSSVTLVFEAGDDTEAEANPIRLHWHHSERQSMETHRDTEEVSAGTPRILEELKDLTRNAEDQIPRGPLRGTKDEFPKLASSDTVDKVRDEIQQQEDLTMEDRKGDKIRKIFQNEENMIAGALGDLKTEKKQNEEAKYEPRDEFGRIASDILQGERLLQRLQLVQQRQEADMSQEVRHEMEHEEKFLAEAEIGGDQTGQDQKDQIRFHTIRTKTSLLEREKTEGTERGETQEKILEHFGTPTREANCSDDTPSLSCESPISSNETISTSSTLRSARHRFSVTETSTEKQIHEDAQGKQNSQRSGGILNLADDPDVLEIPFKTNIVFKVAPTKICQDQDDEWQLKVPSQESPRRLGTGQEEVSEFGRKEAHQKTKLLFEDFQQDNTHGPTRLRKAASTSLTNHDSPTVLERTLSLDMFSLSEKKKSSENLGSKIPSAGSRDRTRLSPYPNVRLCRSSDSISSDVSVVENDRSEGTGREAPVLQQNPFFKLRPASALKPKVEEDIREAEAREDELRKQRDSLYGEKQHRTEEGDKPKRTSTVIAGGKQRSRGKLERVWPPPSKKEQLKFEHTQVPSVHRAGNQRSNLWQRWEFGQINGQPSPEKD
ncbi:uncharacterized protein LOC119126258 [Syngnathus acus]|uniref:uncharacterized protein LOC119126258 n=1 Tax=Syngnathus acus TaxID=161584 RepID=UPI0018864AE3|nr:uncharacterized protein LOC119126258 [Syngnathus acus]